MWKFNIYKIANYGNTARRFLCFFLIMVLLTFTPSCERYLELNTITDQLSANQVFESDGTANSAIAGIYRLSKDNLIYATTIYNGLASDELQNYSPNPLYDNYRNNQILSTEATLPWNGLYSIVYSCNSAINGLEKGTGINDKARNHYIGEAKFNRAYVYFYLVNLFGEVPLITSTDISQTSNPSRNSVDDIYKQIIADLSDAKNKLDNDYSFTGGERIRANKWAASSLLARVFLYQGDWANAEMEANSVINSGFYTILDGPSGIFEKNNSEAILQWANNSTESNVVATNFIFTFSPEMSCTSFLLNAFENGDQRKEQWIKSQIYSSSGETIYYPFKFTSTTVNPSEYYTVLRLSEQYLIRAEARAMQDDFIGAISDLNLIRSQHGRLNVALPAPTNQNVCLDLVLHERQVELFTEGMHRWLDLKRTGKIDMVMQVEKPTTWKSSSVLYPIPSTEIQRNSNLKQNPGYN